MWVRCLAQPGQAGCREAAHKSACLSWGPGPPVIISLVSDRPVFIGPLPPSSTGQWVTVSMFITPARGGATRACREGPDRDCHCTYLVTSI